MLVLMVVLLVSCVQALIAGEGKSPRSFAVQISQDELSADEIAARYGLINKGQVSASENDCFE